MKLISFLLMTAFMGCVSNSYWITYNPHGKYTRCFSEDKDIIVIENHHKVQVFSHQMNGMSKIKIDNLILYCPTVSLYKR
jgi:hypothetical protein